MNENTLYLASASPRRRDLLRALGLEFAWGGVEADERRLPDEDPEAMVMRLAAAKALAAPPGPVAIGADTAVVLGNRVFGKPASREEALATLAALSGRSHRVLTGVAVRSRNGIDRVVSATEVRFREVGPDEALAYWQSGEPRDKAGAYAIQGKGGAFVESIAGSYTGVVGLPVFETARLLVAAGIDLFR